MAGRFAPAIELAAAEGGNINPRRSECHLGDGLNFASCVYGGKTWKVVVVGDSHAEALVSAVAHGHSKGEAGVVQWTYAGCPFLPGATHTPGHLRGQHKNYQCSAFIKWVQSNLKTLPSNIPVVIINRYAQAALGHNEYRHLVEVPEVYFSKVFDRSTPEFLAEFARHMTQSACELAKRRTVYMMRPIPELGFDVPKTLSRRMVVGLNDDLSIPLEDYRQRNAWVWAAQDAARDQCGIKILDPIPYLCRDGRCYGSQAGRPIYSDDDHLSEFGNKLLAPMFAQVFEWLPTN